MAITSTGLGSGLDVENIVTQLMAVERQPLSKLQTAAKTLETKVSAYGKLQSYVSAFRDAAAKLAQPTSWNAVQVASSDTTAVNVTGSASSGSKGSYSIAVSQLATSQSIASAPFASKASTVGEGTLTLELGRWSGSSFSAKSGSSAVNLSIAATDTLAQVRDKINAADAGVQASIISDASGSRLVIKSEESGAENGFRITQGDGGTLGALTYGGPDDLAVDNDGTAQDVRKLTQAAGDAQATINGLAITSASNTLTDVIDGVSLKLSKVTSAPVDVSVDADTTTLKTSITDFVKAYNDLSAFLKSQTGYDATAKKGGTFQGDSGVNSIRSALRGLVSAEGGTSTTYKRLAQLGLDIQSDGSIKTSTTKLDAAMTNLDEVRKLFAGSGTTKGLGYALRSWGDALLSTDGAITTRTASLQSQVSSNSKQQSAFEEKMTGVEKRLRAQYSSLDTKMSNLSQLSGYVSQQISAWSSN